MHIPKSALKQTSGNLTFAGSKESNVTTSWGVEWDEQYIARDILQNFYDANKDEVDKINISIEKRNNIVISAPAEFNIQQLFYLGSQKTEEDVGQYGEGFKAACVCLLRDHNLTPVAITGQDVYHIRLSETPVAGTDMYPMIYDLYTMDGKSVGSKFILENCNPKLVEAFRLGLSNFFFTVNHPIVGKQLEDRGWSPKTNIYHSKDGSGYIYFEKMMRAKLGPKVPLVFEITYPYKRIKKKIGLDRDRKTFSQQDDLSFFFKEIKMSTSLFKNVLKATEASLWSKGHTHELLEYHSAGYSWRENHSALFQNYYVKSSSKDIIEQEKIRQIEKTWQNNGRRPIAKVFLKMGAKSALTYLAELRAQAKKKSDEAAKRAPEDSEWRAIELMRSIMVLYAPETAKIFQRDKSTYIIIDSEALLGEFKSNRGYRERTVYLSSKLFVSGFAEILTTFIHEHQHIYGSDGSSSFTYALTNLIEVFIELRHELDHFEEKWERLRQEIIVERETAGSARPLTVQERISRMDEKTLRAFVLKFPTSTLRKRLES
jgi:hypothetical protein